jgi:PEP-CTERM motif
MNRSFLVGVVGFLICSGALAPAAASADTISFTGLGKSASVTIESPVLGRISVRAGELNWIRTGEGELADSFFAYCIDANAWVQATQTVALSFSDDFEEPGVADAGPKAAWLVNTYAPTIRSAGTNTDAAALQVAMWAAIYNGSGSLSDGPFKLYTPGAIAVQAQAYLDSLFTGPGGYRTSQTAWLDADSGQHQMIPTPEPATLLLMGTGLALAYRARRREKH